MLNLLYKNSKVAFWMFMQCFYLTFKNNTQFLQSSLENDRKYHPLICASALGTLIYLSEQKEL